MNSNNQQQPSQKEYKSLLIEIFKTIKDKISKNNHFYEEIEIELQNIEPRIEEDTTLNADIYFPLIAKALVHENQKIAEVVLRNSKLLIENNFLLGNSKDSPLLQLNEGEAKNRKMIDTIIDTFIKLDNYKNESLLILISDVFNEMIINTNVNVHGKSLVKIYKFYIHLYSKIKSKTNLPNINEKFNVLADSIINKVKDNNNNNQFNFNTQYDNNISIYSTDKSITQSCSIYNNNNTNISTKQISQMKVMNSIIEGTVREMVDTICLLDVDGVLNGMKLIPINKNDFQLFEQFNPQKIPYKHIKNEMGYCSGSFGWCFICRQPANYYCVHTRKAICSENCKDIVKDMYDKADYITMKQKDKDKDNGIINDTQVYDYYDEAVMFIKFICQTLINDATPNKIKELLLITINILITNDNKIFFSYQPLMITKDLTEALIKNLLSDDILIFERSLDLFSNLFNTMREYLKRTISVVNNTILLKLLINEHIDISQKTKILNFLSDQTDQHYLVEMYYNYDCQLYEIYISDKIFNTLNKIIQAKCEDGDDSNENFILKKEAVKTLANIVESIKTYCHNYYISSKHNNNNTSTISQSHSNSQNEKGIERDINIKNKMRKAAEIFKQNINKGITYLLSNECNEFINTSTIDESANSISYFLRHTPGLKKESIGNYLGENGSFELKVLSIYANSFNYKDQHLLSALRLFLSTFKLPGESQKIDRILEQFAIKYHKDNPSSFESSDQIYFIAFSIMILQTSIHNPNVKDKLTLEQFVQMHNDTPKVDFNYLKDIYEEIQKNPFSLPELDQANTKSNTNKEETIKTEKKRILNEAFNKLHNYPLNTKPYQILFQKYNYIKSFINNFWSIIYAMFGVVIRFSDDASLLDQSINGMVNCIKITFFMNMKSSKEIILSDLSPISDFFYVKELTMKSIHRIKALLELANDDICFLENNWESIFNIIDVINLYHLSKKGSKADKEKIYTQLKEKNKESNTLAIELNNIELIVQHIEPEQYENIQQKTEKFPQQSFIDFIKSLCKFTRELFISGKITKQFWFDMLVSVLETNIHRTINNEWSEVWNEVSNFSIEIGLSENVSDATVVVNSLKQLIKKYLNFSKETNTINYQQKFFKPLLKIWQNTLHDETKKMISQSLKDIIHHHCKEIKEGWSIILQIYSTVTHPNNKTKDILKTTLKTLHESRDDLLSQTNEYLTNFVECLKQFVEEKPTKVLKVLDIYNTFIPNITNIKQLTSLCFGYYNLIDKNQQHEDNNITDLTTEHLIKCLNTNLPKLTLDKEMIVFFDKLYMHIIIPLMHILSIKKASKLKMLFDESAKWFELYFNANYKLIQNYFDALSCILCINKNEDVIRNGILESIKDILHFDKLRNIYFLKNYIDLIIVLITKNIPHELEKLSLSLDQYKIKNILSTCSFNICILDTLLPEIVGPFIDKFIYNLEDKDVNNLLLALDSLFSNCNKIICSFETRQAIHKEFKYLINMNPIQNNTINYLFKIMKERNEDNKYKKQIISKTKNILNWFIILDKEIDNNDNDNNVIYKEDDNIEDIIETEEQKMKMNEIENLEKIVLTEVFPMLKHIKIFEDKQYKDDILKIILSLIESKRYEIRKKVKEFITDAYRCYYNEEIFNGDDDDEDTS